MLIGKVYGNGGAVVSCRLWCAISGGSVKRKRTKEQRIGKL